MMEYTQEEIAKFIVHAPEMVFDRVINQLLSTMQREVKLREACLYGIRNFDRLGFQDRAEAMQRLVDQCEYRDVEVKKD